jgi:acetyl-CoA carboxylase biotin carboxyl carrier protein
MTHRPSREPGRPIGGDQRELDTPDQSTGSEQDVVLERVRHNIVQLLSTLSYPPQAIRVRTGEVTIDIEWAQSGTGSPESIMHTPSNGFSAGHSDCGQPIPSSNGAERLLIAQVVGVFYRAPEPGAKPFIEEGDTVVVGQQVAIIEAMKMMIPVEADISGRVIKALKGDGAPVEYGEPLFALAATETS